MKSTKCIHDEFINLIDGKMQALCDEASEIRRAITKDNIAYGWQIERLVKIHLELEDFALVFDQASGQIKELCRQMKEFNEELITNLKPVGEKDEEINS